MSLPNEPSSSVALSENDWKRLLRDIGKGQVVPVVGPHLVYTTDIETGCDVPLGQWVAGRLHHMLELPGTSADFPTPHAVTCEAILRGVERLAIVDHIRELMDAIKAQPTGGINDPLLNIASITDFLLYISTTFDPLLADALVKERPTFSPQRDVFRYHYAQPCDLPDPITATTLFHIVGDYDTYPDFAIWEEDYVEFMCGLVRDSDAMKNFMRYVKNRYLLFLGSPFSDWIVRFFLRLVRQERLSSRSRNGVYRKDLMAEQSEILSNSMIFYFDKVTGATLTVPGSPRQFVTELTRRWKENFDSRMTGEMAMPEHMPRESIFISYSSEDRDAALTLANALNNAGVPVWFDKQRLQLGSNFTNSLEHAIKDDCSFFISLISSATESDVEHKRYLHRERAWAASRQVDGFIFYLPIIIDPAIKRPKCEPEKCGSALLHIVTAPSGRPGPELIRRIKSLMDEYRHSGRPKG